MNLIYKPICYIRCHIDIASNKQLKHDIHLQVTWRGAILVGFCHRMMMMVVDLADGAGGALLLLLLAVGLDDRPKPALPHHNHRSRITRESHACVILIPSYRQLIDLSCSPVHCTSYIAPIIAGTFVANDVKCKH